MTHILSRMWSLISIMMACKKQCSSWRAFTTRTHNTCALSLQNVKRVSLTFFLCDGWYVAPHSCPRGIFRRNPLFFNFVGLFPNTRNSESNLWKNATRTDNSSTSPLACQHWTNATNFCSCEQLNTKTASPTTEETRTIEWHVLKIFLSTSSIHQLQPRTYKSMGHSQSPAHNCTHLDASSAANESLTLLKPSLSMASPVPCSWWLSRHFGETALLAGQYT